MEQERQSQAMQEIFDIKFTTIEDKDYRDSNSNSYQLHIKNKEEEKRTEQNHSNLFNFFK